MGLIDYWNPTYDRDLTWREEENNTGIFFPRGAGP